MRHSWLESRLTILVMGDNPERIIAAFTQRGMVVSAVVCITPERLFCTIRWNDIPKMRAVHRGLGLRIRFIHREGWRSSILAMRRRKSFFLGAIGFVLALYGLSSLVWDVRIEVGQTIPVSHVVRAATAVGLVPGVWLRTASLQNTERLGKQMNALLPQASWVGVQFRGTIATIRVVEAVVPQPRERKSPQHIVARTDGVVTQMIAQTGVAVVQEHTKVRRGDLLIRGWLNDPATTPDVPIAVVAEGEVRGKVWLTMSVQMPLQTIEWRYTGRNQQKTGLIVLGRFLWGKKSEQTVFDQQTTEQTIHLLRMRNVALPVSRITQTHREVVRQQRQWTVAQAKKKAMERMRAHIVATYGSDVLFERTLILQEGVSHGKVNIKAVYAVEMDLGTPQPFVPEP